MYLWSKSAFNEILLNRHLQIHIGMKARWRVIEIDATWRFCVVSTLR